MYDAGHNQMDNTSHAIDRVIEGAQEYVSSKAGSSAHLQDLGSLLLNLSRENLHPFLLLGDDRFKFGDGCLKVFALLRVTQRGIAAAHTAERNFRRMRLGLDERPAHCRYP